MIGGPNPLGLGWLIFFSYQTSTRDKISSMKPRSGERGNIRLSAVPAFLKSLQWGRAPGSAEMPLNLNVAVLSGCGGLGERLFERHADAQ